MTYDIITVGSATLDVFAQTDNETIDIHTKRSTEKLIAYPLGSKILINKINFEVGGGGTNTAVCASKIGLKTAYLGNLGRDQNGENVINLLKQEKVDFIGSKTNDMTNYSIILDSFDTDRTILVYKGSSEKFEFDNIPKTKLKTKWFYLCAMVGKGYKQLEKIAKYASENDIKIAFNPSNYLAEKGSKYLEKVLTKTDLLILNREEAELLCGKNSPKDLVRMLKKLGPRNVVVTDGKEKITVLYHDEITEYKPTKLKPRETTGAGDAFGATLVSGIILNKPIKKAVAMALKNSQSVIMNLGAKKGLLKKGVLLK